jgi:hypothetical protein
MGRTKVIVGAVLLSGFGILLGFAVFKKPSSNKSLVASSNSEIKTPSKVRHSEITGPENRDRSPASQEDVVLVKPTDPSLPWAKILQKTDRDPVKARALLVHAKELRRQTKAKNLERATYYLGDLSDHAQGMKPVPALKALLLEDAERLQPQQPQFSDSHWAYFESEDVNQGLPVAFNYTTQRWGVYTGMVEVLIPDPKTYDQLSREIEGWGLKVVKTPLAQDTLYVATDPQHWNELEKVRTRLAAKVGSKNVRPEVLYSRRTPL